MNVLSDMKESVSSSFVFKPRVTKVIFICWKFRIKQNKFGHLRVKLYSEDHLVLVGFQINVK